MPSFTLFAASRVTYGTGNTMLQALLLWQVYQISDSAVSLALLGLARLIPTLILCLIGGAVADSYNRRNIVMAAQCIPLVFATTMGVASLEGWISVELLYVFSAALGVTSAFEAPARNALLPGIVPPQSFPAAVSVMSTLQTLASITGPVLAGALIALVNEGPADFVFTGLATAAILTLSFVRYREDGLKRKAVSWQSVTEGVHFVRRNQVLLGAMSLDLFAVIFGGVKALLPVYATDILHGGPAAFGFLEASFEAGAFLMSLYLLRSKPVARTGRAVIWTVAAFGLGTMLFGISRNLYLSLAIYLLIGAADQLSAVMRETTVQMATPDELRGRVSAVDQVFSNSSNQLGAVESGFVAATAGATFAVVSGGAGTLAVVGFIAWRLRALYDYVVPQFIVHPVKHEEGARREALAVAAGGDD
jgi:MFS family permease